MSFSAVIGDAVQTCEMKSFEWKLRNFLFHFNTIGENYLSPVFSFAGSDWRLILYPNGETVDSVDWVVVYLLKISSGPSKTIHYTLGIKGSDGVKEKRENVKDFSTKYCYNADYWSRSELENQKSTLLPNNTLIVTCDLRTKAFSDEGEIKLRDSLLSMLEAGEDSDIVIKVRGRRFPAHKCILRARSTVFRSMFSHDMVEKRSNVVTIEDCDEETFSDFLVHIYSGRCDHISMNNVKSLYTAADKYDVDELKEACAEFMSETITIASFCDVVRWAIKYVDGKLMERMQKFFCENCLSIAESDEWKTFLEENPEVGNVLFIRAMST